MKKYFLLLFGMILAMSAFAQKEERTYIRKANKLFNDSSYTKSEILYRKAIDKNANSVEGHYNLGNNLFKENKLDEAIKEYTSASKVEKDKDKLGHIYHNMGVALQKQKKYKECIDAYKNALKNNPDDMDTKYNLAMALRMLKQQQQEQQNQNQNQDKQQQNQNNQENNKQNNKQNDKKDENKDDNSQQPQQPQQDNLSKENAEQLLNSIMQDEKNVQGKVQRKLNASQKQDLDKNW